MSTLLPVFGSVLLFHIAHNNIRGSLRVSLSVLSSESRTCLKIHIKLVSILRMYQRRGVGPVIWYTPAHTCMRLTFDHVLCRSHDNLDVFGEKKRKERTQHRRGTPEGLMKSPWNDESLTRAHKASGLDGMFDHQPELANRLAPTTRPALMRGIVEPLSASPYGAIVSRAGSGARWDLGPKAEPEGGETM
jgi:hypothetical protein